MTRLPTAALLVFGLLGSSVAQAEGDATTLKEELAALDGAVADHKRARAKGALLKDIQAAVALYKKAGDEDSIRKGAVRLVGGLARSRERAVRLNALRALGEMGDPAASTYIKPHLAQKNKKKSSPELETAIEAAGKAPSARLVDSLLRLVTKSKQLSVAANAMKALGKYGKIKGKRKKILVELVKTVEKDRPGVRPGKDVDGDNIPDLGSAVSGEQSQNRWIALSSVLTPTLNELTGRKLKYPEEWFQTVKSYKSRLDAVFVD